MALQSTSRSTPPNCSLAESLASLSDAERTSILAELTKQQARDLLYNWRGFWARPNQVRPPGDWRYWLVQAGRGFGKTRTGAECVREWINEGHRRIALVGPTAYDARHTMVEGESGLLSIYPHDQRPHYNPSIREIRWSNGAMATLYSADEPDRLRGPQHDCGWCDEISSYRYPEAWDNLLFGLRLGSDPRIVITTTPKPVKLVKDIASDPHTIVTRASTYDNRANLPPAFFTSIIAKYEGTRIGRQELMGELLEDVPGALWTRGMIDAARITLSEVRWDLVTRVVVAIDPAVSSSATSDETGIVVVALTRSGHVLVLDDLSCRETPLGWARIAVAAYKSRGADRIVGEVNNGGDLVEANIRAVAPEVAFRAVRASRGKAIRAEPVAALYEQGRVHHVGSLATLEDQQCSWTPQGNERSPDRLDALVWGVAELVVDAEPQSITMTFGEGYQISPI